MKKLIATFFAAMLFSPFLGCSEQQQLENEMEDVQDQKEVLAETLEDAADDINSEVEQLKEEQQDVVEEKTRVFLERPDSIRESGDGDRAHFGSALQSKKRFETL